MRTPTIVRPNEAATRLGVSTSTLKRWNANGYGPKRIKIGPHAVGYRLADLDAFVSHRAAA